MKGNNILQNKSFAFAVEVYCLHRKLNADKEYVLAKQLIRSGTAVGALTEEAIGAQSLRDFLHKLSIAYKEARETKYWLRLLEATNTLHRAEIPSLLQAIGELLRIIGSIQITVKKKMKNEPDDSTNE